MTIDPADYAPRPADDHFAELRRDASWRHDLPELEKWNSMLLGLSLRDRNPCHQLGCNFNELPDYLNDLNAMHSAIRILTDGQRAEFRKHLTKVWTRDYNSRCGCFPSHDDSCNATAAQRAEAFLRTLNLWTD